MIGLGCGIIFAGVGYEFLLLTVVSCLVPVFIFCSVKYIFGNKEIFRKHLVRFELVSSTALVVLLFFERFFKLPFIVIIMSEVVVLMLCEIVILKNDMKSGAISAFGAECILVISKFMTNFLIFRNLNINIFRVKIISNVFIVLLAIMAVVMIFYKQFDDVVKDMLANNKESCFKGIHIFIMVIIIVANIVCYNLVSEQKGEVLFSLNIAITLMYCVFGLITVNMFNKYEKGMEELRYQYYYNKTLSYLMKDLRRFKHDYNNMLAVMGGFLQLKKYDELNKYYESIAKNIKYSSVDSNKSMTKIKNAGILGLLLYKLNLSKDRNVNFIIEVNSEIGRMDIKVNEFCEILGILLDNAIEAAVETKAKMVKLEVSQKSNYKIFLIRNSVAKKIDVKEIYKRGYSTKGKNRGVGLAVVYELIEKSKDMYLDSMCNDEEFIQKLILKCNNLDNNEQ